MAQNLSLLANLRLTHHFKTLLVVAHKISLFYKMIVYGFVLLNPCSSQNELNAEPEPDDDELVSTRINDDKPNTTLKAQRPPTKRGWGSYK